jgi:hypothetical protein
MTFASNLLVASLLVSIELASKANREKRVRLLRAHTHLQHLRSADQLGDELGIGQRRSPHLWLKLKGLGVEAIDPNGNTVMIGMFRAACMASS